MHEHADRLDFAPPHEPAAARAFVLAILAHLLLMLALTWGVNWKRESENTAVEAELWSAVPQQAAPRVVQAPPLPAVVTPPPPPPAPPAPVVAPPPPPPAVAKQPDIALEREKRKQELAERKREELERQRQVEAREKREELARAKVEAQKKQEEAKQKKLAEQKEKKLAEQKAAEEKKKEELAKAKQEEAAREAIRQAALDRMKAAAATGAPSSTGTAARASGPSDSYAGRIQARVRPHIVFTDDVAGNPKAEVEVRMAPDGTIVSRKLVKSSGVKAWDDAVLRALDKTETLPRDIDGRVHTPLTIDFRPKG